MSRKQRETERRSDEGDQLYLQQQQQYHEYETPLRVEADDANADADAQGQAQRPSALTIIVSPSPNQATDSCVNMNDDDTDLDAGAMLDDTMPLSSSRRLKRKSKNRAKKPRVDMHAFRTCIILAMPWTAYAVFSTSIVISRSLPLTLCTCEHHLRFACCSTDTIFHDVRTSYMTSMGISDSYPRFVPPLVTFFLGPILGAASDRSLSKWGRRNVFLVSAALILTVSGLLFGSAQMLFSKYTGVTNLLLFLLSIGVLLINVRILKLQVAINRDTSQAYTDLKTCLCFVDWTASAHHGRSAH